MSKYILIAVTVMIVAVLSMGCNPNQWTAKEIIDGSGIEQGEVITIQQKDGERVSGTFLGTAIMPFDQYQAYYTSSTQMIGSSSLLPFIGQRVKFSTAVMPDKIWEGQLVGFDKHSLLIKFDGVLVPEDVYITSVVGMTDKNGQVLQQLTFRHLYLNGDIPLMTVLRLKSNSGEVQVPMNSILGVTYHDQTDLAHSITLSAAQFENSLKAK